MQSDRDHHRLWCCVSWPPLCGCWSLVRKVNVPTYQSVTKKVFQVFLVLQMSDNFFCALNVSVFSHYPPAGRVMPHPQYHVHGVLDSPLGNAHSHVRVAADVQACQAGRAAWGEQGCRQRGGRKRREPNVQECDKTFSGCLQPHMASATGLGTHSLHRQHENSPRTHHMACSTRTPMHARLTL